MGIFCQEWVLFPRWSYAVERAPVSFNLTPLCVCVAVGITLKHFPSVSSADLHGCFEKIWFSHFVILSQLYLVFFVLFGDTLPSSWCLVLSGVTPWTCHGWMRPPPVSPVNRPQLIFIILYTGSNSFCLPIKRQLFLKR